MISFRDKKEIREMLINHYNSGKAKITKEPGCPVCGESLLLRTKGIICLHHMLHDHPGNRVQYKNFIHSPSNLLPYHAACQGHEDKYSVSNKTAELFEYIFSEYKILACTENRAWHDLVVEVEKSQAFAELQFRPEYDYGTFLLSLGVIYQKVKNK